jgi:hypothetical protein
MPYFTDLAAPDLSDVGEPLATRMILALLFHGKESPASAAESRLLTGFVMVTDKALREYKSGREALILYSKSANQMGLMFEGVGRMETCISSAKRAFRFLERLVALPATVQVDRTLRRLVRSWENSLTPIRDAIEHIDGDIISESGIKPGDAHLLAMSKDGEHLELLTHRLSLNDLAKALRSLHRAGLELLGSLPSVPPSSGAVTTGGT